MFEIIDKLAKFNNIEDEELLYILNSDDKNLIEYLFLKANEIRKKIYSNKVYIRGLIEISNICKNDCYYCGIRKSNRNIKRYRLSKEEILACAKKGYELGFRTLVLQGGEDLYFSDEILIDIIKEIKNLYPNCALTLSLGERSYESYEKLFNVGVDRYLSRHETINKCHYEKLHPNSMSYQNRIQCLKNLKKIGYQTGCGLMVGSPYQTNENLVEDLRFIKEFNPEMVGIGPFIPHCDTPYKNESKGDLILTLKMLALTRLLVPEVLLPATTALATLSPEGRKLGLNAGANVIMPNLTPDEQEKNYRLYDNKLCEETNIEKLKKDIAEYGYEIVVSRGDNVRYSREED